MAIALNRPFLVGNYPLSIDAKNRLSIPNHVRSQINADEHGRAFIVVPGRRRGILAVYPDRYFKASRSEVPRDEQLSEATHAWRQFEMSQSVFVDPDGQGRITLPAALLERAGLKKEVTLAGAQDHLEIWDRAEYEEFEASQWANYSQARSDAVADYRESGWRSDASGEVAMSAGAAE